MARIEKAEKNLTNLVKLMALCIACNQPPNVKPQRKIVDILVARTKTEIESCFPAFHELRVHLSEQEFVAQVQRQMKNHGYVLVYIVSQGQVIAAAGYRLAEFLGWGRVFYVDDLITMSAFRKQGYGGKLLDYLIEAAKELSCKEFHLDSGVHRHDAHRLYLSRKLRISSHHFSMALD